MPSPKEKEQEPVNRADDTPPSPASEPTDTRLHPDLTVTQRKSGPKPGNSYVRTERPYHHLFRNVRGRLVATTESYAPVSGIGRLWRSVKAALIGRPLLSSHEMLERLTKIKALAVFGSDAISSSAYATEAALVVLVAAGSGALHLSFYMSVGIAILLAIVSFSYRQIVHAYPHGGGAYNVSRQNLGQTAGLIAAAALMIDYVMTVAVSIAAGSLAVTSALIASGHGGLISTIDSSLPAFLNLNVLLSLFFIGVIVLGNLRGIRESGSIFAVPTYLFIFSLAVLLIVGMAKVFTHTLAPATPPPTLPIVQPLTLWLILRAFSAGAVAMSGTEAISNGVPAFKPPESKNAATTISVMAILLGTFFVGVSYFATHMKLVPGSESIISQVAQAVFGRNVAYYVFQVATMGILVVAANTAFADFPRLSSVLARDEFMPHAFGQRGDRLAFSSGIVFLGVLAALLLMVFKGNVDSLIHLYAVGVFLAFSLSNSGMVVHWWKTRGKGWKTSLAINAAGAILTGLVLIIVAVTKFAFGAWIVIVLIPAIIPLFLFVHRHYQRVGQQLKIVPSRLPPTTLDQFVVVLIDDVNKASLRAMSFARTICEDIIVLHVSRDQAETRRIEENMRLHAPDLRLIVLESRLRSILKPVQAYIDAIQRQHPGRFVSIILPEFITDRWWHRFLHERTAAQLAKAFRSQQEVAVIFIPYLLTA